LHMDGNTPPNFTERSVHAPLHGKGTEQPRLIFMHFWANDDAIKLARGLRAALAKMAVGKSWGPRDERERSMRTLAVVLVLLSACWATDAAQAQSDGCKLCREDYQACVKAHSQGACKANYDICLKHCRRK
jgi:hypothetical protein